MKYYHIVYTLYIQRKCPTWCDCIL